MSAKGSFGCLVLFLSTGFFGNIGAATTSSVLRLESGWRFSLEPGNRPERIDFDDSRWGVVGIPNNAKEVSNEYPRSMRSVWFRKRFSLPSIASDARVTLVVSGVRSGEAWINGVSVGETPESRIRFETDVTSQVRSGDNVVTLRTAVPGILGGVRLHIRGPVHLHTYGLLVDTVAWQGGPAEVRIRTEIENHSELAKTFELTATVQDDQGRQLASVRSGKMRVAASQTTPVELKTPLIDHPPLWTPDAPRLCRVTGELREEGQVVQAEETSFGFRWFNFDPDDGFFLNGESLKLRGTVYTKTTPEKFRDVSSLWNHEVELLKGMGINFVRPAESGIGDHFFDVCDRAGLLATAQVTVQGDVSAVLENVRSDVLENYNHPSVINWNFNGEGKSAGIARLQSEAAKELRRLDSSRPVFCVELGWRSPGTVGLVDADIAGQGNYTGWYEGTLDHIGPYMDTYRRLLNERYPEPLPIIVSNYGAAGDPDLHSDHPRRNDYTHEYHTAFHRRFQSEIAARPWVAGGLIFVFRDIQSEQPIPRHTFKGVIDINEQKRDAYYYYQSVWTDRPMIHIAQQSWTPRDVWPPDASRKIEVFSNCDSVTLFLNGRSLGSRTKKAGFAWDSAFVAGPNVLRAVGKRGASGVEETANVEVRFRPPVVNARLLSENTNEMLELRWDSIMGVDEYSVFGGPDPQFPTDSAHLIVTTSENSLQVEPPQYDFHYKVVALGEEWRGPPSAEVGWGPGAMQWRFPNEGWLLSSPALADLDSDGDLEIVVGSYSGWVYALDHRGQLLWQFETTDPVFSSPAVASLARGERPSVVVNSSTTLYVLTSDGGLRWKYDGIRQFDRNVKSPAIGDLDSDGRPEVILASDTGELLVFSSNGSLRWRYRTAGQANRGINLTTPALIDLADGTRGIVLGADDGMTYLLDPAGKLKWKYDSGIGDDLPGAVPGSMTAAIGRLEQDGPVRIVTGAHHLRVLDLDGRVVWERDDIRGRPQISRLSRGRNSHVVVPSGRTLNVLDGKGRDVWKFTLDHPRDFFTQAPVSADLDEDGEPDLVLGSRATYLYAISSQGKLLWKFRTDDELSASPAVADLNRDGYTDVVFGSRDGYIYMVGAGSVPEDAVTSLQYRAGPERRASYTPD